MRLLIAAVLAVATPAAAKVWPSPAASPAAANGPAVVFTFDDGPNPITTPKVLDILAKRQIHAVFFIVGRRVDPKHKQVAPLIERILREGHVIANHTMTHPDLCELEDPFAAAAEIDDGKQVIEQVARVPLVWFRAPFGARCDRLEAQLAERAIQHMHWDVDPQEWRHRSAKHTVAYVTRSLSRASTRNVLLLHDIHRVTVKALPEILDWIDAENARRAIGNRPPIRIVQAPELAAEQLAPGLAEWTEHVVGRLAEVRADLASLLPSTHDQHAAR